MNIDKNVDISILSKSSQAFKELKEKRSINVNVQFNVYEINQEKDCDFDYNDENILNIEIDLKKK